MTALLIAAVVSIQAQVEVPVVWTGSGSMVTTPEFAVIESEYEWMRCWLRHLGLKEELARLEAAAKTDAHAQRYSYYNEGAVPNVNFTTHVIAVLFGGSTHQIAGYSIMTAQLFDKKLVLRYAPRYYSVALGPGGMDEFRETPFAFVLLPRKFEAIRFEEGIIEQKGKPITKFQLRKELRLAQSRGGSTNK